MGKLMISYPITVETGQALANLPAIAQRCKLPNSGRSDLEIVRLLSNTHYKHILKLLEFIEKWVDIAEPITERILKTQHPFELNQIIAELFLFTQLYKKLRGKVEAVQSGAAPKCPDIKASLNSYQAFIEVYSSIDFLGFQLFNKYVPMVLKYLNIPYGYKLIIRTQVVQEVSGYDPEETYYPYSFPNEDTIYDWLKDFSSTAAKWLQGSEPKDIFKMRGPGGKIEISITIRNKCKNVADRRIISLGAPKSTDTKLFFEVGSPEDTETALK